MDKELIKTEIMVDTDICTHPAGHCYGNDGGSGISDNLKVAEGRGGSLEVEEYDRSRTLLSKAVYSRCQYCQKYLYVQETEDSPQRP